MTDRNVLNALNEAGETLRALGEPVILLAFYADTERFSLRLPLDGHPTGIQGSGTTPVEALKDAQDKREIIAADMAREALVRAEIEARAA